MLAYQQAPGHAALFMLACLASEAHACAGVGLPASAASISSCHAGNSDTRTRGLAPMLAKQQAPSTISTGHAGPSASQESMSHADLERSRLHQPGLPCLTRLSLCREAQPISQQSVQLPTRCAAKTASRPPLPLESFRAPFAVPRSEQLACACAQLS